MGIQTAWAGVSTCRRAVGVNFFVDMQPPVIQGGLGITAPRRPALPAETLIIEHFVPDIEIEPCVHITRRPPYFTQFHIVAVFVLVSLHGPFYLAKIVDGAPFVEIHNASRIAVNNNTGRKGDGAKSYHSRWDGFSLSHILWSIYRIVLTLGNIIHGCIAKEKALLGEKFKIR